MERYRRPVRAGHQQRTVEGRVREQYWPGTLMALGIFALLATVVFLTPFIFIGIGTLFRWLLLFAFVGNLLPYAWSGLRWGMERLEWFLFNLLAVGPFLFSLAIVLNFTVHGPEELFLVGGLGDRSVTRYWAENGGLPPHLPLPQDPKELEALVNTEGELGDFVLGMADGCLGYAVVTTWRPAFQVDEP